MDQGTRDLATKSTLHTFFNSINISIGPEPSVQSLIISATWGCQDAKSGLDVKLSDFLDVYIFELVKKHIVNEAANPFSFPTSKLHTTISRKTTDVLAKSLGSMPLHNVRSRANLYSLRQFWA